MKSLLIFGLLMILFLFQTSCVKEVEKIVNVRDTVIVIQKDTITIEKYIRDTGTVLVLTRHAETSGLGTNPGLSALGIERANDLAKLLKPTIFQNIYSSNYNRTIQTANIAAANYSLIPILYDPLNQNQWIQDLINQNKNKKLLIVGHSNTIPELLNILSGTKDYTTIPESEYNNLYIVNLAEIGRFSILHLKYGK
ncbi:MAG: histidine phosphatase family protein [Saprospiraceae bacterium]|nr:histidine phosphatase family protein [Saprospiraceae bacterium]